MTAKRYLLVAMSFILMIGIILEGRTAAGPPKSLTFKLTGLRVGTTMHTRAQLLAEALKREYPGWEVHAIAITSTPERNKYRKEGSIHAFLNGAPRTLYAEAYSPAYAKRGLDYEKEVPEFDVILPTTWKIQHLYTLRKTGLTSFKDIVDKRYPIKIAYAVTNETPILKRIMEFYGTSWEEMKGWGSKLVVDASALYPSAMEYVASGAVNVGFGFSGTPAPALLQVSASQGLRMLPIAEEPGLLDKLKELGFYRYVIPAGTYPFADKDVTTVAFPEWLCFVRGTLADEEVYWVTKGLWNQREFLISGFAGFKNVLTPEFIVGHLGAPKMPTAAGAERFFREKGWIK